MQQLAVEEEVTVVASTRTERRIEDQPMRVEVLNREEVEEKMLMTPGDIGMMLNEMGGLRVQATSPSLGAASVRIQGMRGRYTVTHLAIEPPAPNRVARPHRTTYPPARGQGDVHLPGTVSHCHGNASATYSPGMSSQPTATTMYCLPSTAYVIGTELTPPGNSTSPTTSPVALS